MRPIPEFVAGSWLVVATVAGTPVGCARVEPTPVPFPGERTCVVREMGSRHCDEWLAGGMELTELVPYRVIAESGNWHGVEGILTLRFLKIQQGTRVTAEGSLLGRGPFAIAAAVSGRWAPEAVRKDLLRASEILTRHGDGQPPE